MPEYVGSVLLLLCALQVKHLFGDFFLQTPKMLSGRCAYAHMGRAQHAGVHVIGSALVFLLFGAPLMFILILAVLEWAVHFHIDFGKARFSERKKLNPQQAMFWQALGSDQALHQLTYLAMAWAWVKYAAM
ncbi:DUF3307 domain-containing protein [Leisingera daeponensis]|uniref:DUF3307 domain-containing protein n=1 Tax=Leisingera daeponensis TaxID=405746 RepID=A0ABS7NEW7_9RHOB|nr:DUF3307 domain-containing protein [Leisingera daeponensis]MBY6056118.1 DUF3307 domain-containing protein [Leisingera daeponensis]MBY6139739.1 DUF3307 domain-containing protein [Leisingera daeponensis]